MLRIQSKRLPSLVQKRSFIVAALAALSNSNYLKNIQMADEMEDIHHKVPSKLDEFIQSQKVQPAEERTFSDGRIKLNTLERTSLFLISGISSFLHPEVGYNINNFGEVSSFECILKDLRNQMLSTASGRKILRERPLMNPQTLDPNWLKTLPENTLGYQYYQFTQGGDERAPVKLIEDEELAYVFLRYRQIHDIVHILTKSKIDLAGELPVKAFEFGNTGLPMTGIACFAYFKLSPKRKARTHMIDSFLNGLQATPFITIRWEDWMEKDVEWIRKELKVTS